MKIVVILLFGYSKNARQQIELVKTSAQSEVPTARISTAIASTTQSASNWSNLVLWMVQFAMDWSPPIAEFLLMCR